jgi:hypothetical protein
MKGLIKKLLREGLVKEEEYFDTTLPDDVKRQSSEYVGRGVTWYGDPNQMIVINKNYVDGMFGNIYDHEKLAFVTDLIETHDENVEFECSYAMGSMIDFTDIREHQEAEVGDRFMTDYDGVDAPASIGDDDLDNYIGSEELDDTELMSMESWDDLVLYKLLNDNKFFLVYGKSVDYLKGLIANVNKENLAAGEDELSENDMEYISAFIEVETNLYNAVRNGDGDMNTFRIQLRDGHHRVMGSIAAGENYICVNLERDDLKRFAEQIDSLNYVNKVN